MHNDHTPTPMVSAYDVASDYGLWGTYVDTLGIDSREEFDRQSIIDKMSIVYECSPLTEQWESSFSVYSPEGEHGMIRYVAHYARFADAVAEAKRRGGHVRVMGVTIPV